MKTRFLSRALVPLAVAACFCLTPLRSTSAHPQEASDQKKGMHDALQNAVNELNLSDDQKTKLQDVFSNAKSKREGIWNDSSLTDDQKKSKMKELQSGIREKVNAILTPEQRAQLKEKMQAAKANHPE